MARWPVDAPRTTPHGAYAYPRRRRDHHGVDLAGARGTVVYAPEAMTVIAVGRGLSTSGKRTGTVTRSGDALAVGVGLAGYGPGAVLARGASGLVHVLGHLDDGALPAVGAELAEGATVGTISRVGHVHWEVRKPDAYPWPRATRGADTADPAVWLAAMRALPFQPGAAPDADALDAATSTVRAVARKLAADVRARAVGEVAMVALLALLLGGRRRR